MDGNRMQEGFGVVQLGEVKSYGQWKVLDEQIEMSFESRSLSLEKQADLEHYRNSSQPLQVQLPGDRRPAWGVVIGFQRNDRTATFYVTLPSQKKLLDQTPGCFRTTDLLNAGRKTHAADN